MQKMGWFGTVRGHSRSWAMSPFDRANIISYSTLIEAMRLSYNRHISRKRYKYKIADFNSPNLRLAPRWG